MAAKLLHSLTEENQDLQKQIGCMTGIFQLFDRQSMLASRRLIGNSPKRLTSGNISLCPIPRYHRFIVECVYFLIQITFEWCLLVCWKCKSFYLCYPLMKGRVFLCLIHVLKMWQFPTSQRISRILQMLFRWYDKGTSFL